MNLANGDIVLFQGDSITDGNRGRSEDPNHILGHGYACMVSARLGADHVTEKPVFVNRGVSGDSLIRMYARWQEDTIDVKPTVLNILIGGNDMGWTRTATPSKSFERLYRMLLEDTLEMLPGIRIILCEPFFLPLAETRREQAAKVERVCTHLTELQQIVRKLAKEYEFTFFPFQDMFDSLAQKVDSAYLVWDGIHPTMVGHEFMTRRWLETVG